MATTRRLGKRHGGAAPALPCNRSEEKTISIGFALLLPDNIIIEGPSAKFVVKGRGGDKNVKRPRLGLPRLGKGKRRSTKNGKFEDFDKKAFRFLWH